MIEYYICHQIYCNQKVTTLKKFIMAKLESVKEDTIKRILNKFEM